MKKDNETGGFNAAISNDGHQSQVSMEGTGIGAEQTGPTAGETSNSVSNAGNNGHQSAPTSLPWPGQPVDYLWDPEEPYLIVDGDMELLGDSSWEPWVVETAWLQQALCRLERENRGNPDTTLFRQNYFIEIAKRTDANLARYDDEEHDIFDLLAAHKVMFELLELVARREADKERVNSENAPTESMST